MVPPWAHSKSGWSYRLEKPLTSLSGLFDAIESRSHLHSIICYWHKVQHTKPNINWDTPRVHVFPHHRRKSLLRNTPKVLTYTARRHFRMIHEESTGSNENSGGLGKIPILWDPPPPTHPPTPQPPQQHHHHPSHPLTPTHLHHPTPPTPNRK